MRGISPEGGWPIVRLGSAQSLCWRCQPGHLRLLCTTAHGASSTHALCGWPGSSFDFIYLLYLFICLLHLLCCARLYVPRPMRHMYLHLSLHPPPGGAISIRHVKAAQLPTLPHPTPPHSTPPHRTPTFRRRGLEVNTAHRRHGGGWAAGTGRPLLHRALQRAVVRKPPRQGKMWLLSAYEVQGCCCCCSSVHLRICSAAQLLSCAFVHLLTCSPAHLLSWSSPHLLISYALYLSTFVCLVASRDLTPRYLPPPLHPVPPGVHCASTHIFTRVCFVCPTEPLIFTRCR